MAIAFAASRFDSNAAAATFAAMEAISVTCY